MGRQFQWWREGGFRWPLLARLTHGRIGLGRWTQAEVDRHRTVARRLSALIDAAEAIEEGDA